jgi:hypothetical protein
MVAFANHQSAAGEAGPRLGRARRGMARFGEGASAHGGGSANRQGSAWLGEAWQGKGLAWRGVLFSNINEGLNYDFSGRYDKTKAG